MADAYFRRTDAHGETGEVPMKAVRTEHPQVIARGLVDGPHVIQRLAWLDGIATRDQFEMPAVVHVKDGGGAAGVAECEPQAGRCSIALCIDLKFIWQRPRGTGATPLLGPFRLGR